MAKKTFKFKIKPNLKTKALQILSIPLWTYFLKNIKQKRKQIKYKFIQKCKL